MSPFSVVERALLRLRIARRWILLALTFAFLSAAQAPAARAPLRVLFIGNSLTAANDLAAMVEAIAAAEPGPRFECKVVAAPNYSLEDHWHQGDAVRAIRHGDWSVVVLQQGPSSLDESRVLLVEYTERFAKEIRRAGARPALYMVWPSQARRADLDRVSASYAAAARRRGPSSTRSFALSGDSPSRGVEPWERRPSYFTNLKSPTWAAVPSFSFSSKRRHEPDHTFWVFHV